ncbi:MAG: hypothetical protein ACXABY_00260 [Candidatus Thorarchaeota archaeon]|jgi:hypothetical protein
MGDKLHDLSPVNVDFSAGEQLTGAKLTSWAQQIDRGFALLEKVIGDPLSDSHPLFSSGNTPAGGWGYNTSGAVVGTEQRHLQILTLARLIGPASVLNPRVLTNNTVTLTQAVLGGQNVFETRYRPISSVSVSEILIDVFSNLVGSAEDVHRFGDYYIDETNGAITYIGAQSGNVGTITYTVDLSAANAGDTYEDATFNVIPDPNQTTKCTVTGPSAGRYTLAIPTATHQQTDWDELTTALDSDEDPNYLQQLTLPTAWAAEFTSGDQLPEGLAKVWDGTANSFLEGHTFYYVDQTSIQVDDTHTLATGSDRYSLVVHGTDIVRLLDQLRTRFHKHEHTGEDGARSIDHRHLTGKARGYATIPHNAGGSDLIIGWTQDTTETDYNDHPQYLHRSGMDDSDLKNAMFGDILFAPQEHDGTDIFTFNPGSISNSSYGLYFLKGAGNDAPRIYATSQSIPFNPDSLTLTLSSNIDNSSYIGRINLSCAGLFNITSISGDVNVLAGDDIHLSHDSAGETIVRGSSSVDEAGRLKVAGDSSAYGKATVQGLVSVEESGDSGLANGDGAVEAEGGFGENGMDKYVNFYWKDFTTSAQGSAPYNLDVSLTDLSSKTVVGYTAMARADSSNLWRDGQVNQTSTWEFSTVYDSSANRIRFTFKDTAWESPGISTVNMRVTVFYRGDV